HGVIKAETENKPETRKRNREAKAVRSASDFWFLVSGFWFLVYSRFPPHRVRHQSRKQNQIPNRAVPRRLHDRRDHHRPAGQGKHRRRHRMSGSPEVAWSVSAAEDEDGGAGEAEEDEVDGDDVAEDLLVRAAE